MERDTCQLILVRHAQPEINTGVPACEWQLSPGGREQAARLAERFEISHLAAIASSDEPKAAETVMIIAQHVDFGAPISLIPALREHERPETCWLSREQFEATLADFFARPDNLVFGTETATQARRRFITAIASLLENSPEGDIIVVTHGNVITLFVAAVTGVEPLTFWRNLTLPAAMTLARSNLWLTAPEAATSAHNIAARIMQSEG